MAKMPSTYPINPLVGTTLPTSPMARTVASSADEKDQRGPNNLSETDDKTVRMTNGMKFTMGKWLRFQAEE